MMMMWRRRSTERLQGQEATGGRLEVEEQELGGQSEERRGGNGEEWRKRRTQVFI